MAAWEAEGEKARSTLQYSLLVGSSARWYSELIARSGAEHLGCIIKSSLFRPPEQGSNHVRRVWEMM